MDVEELDATVFDDAGWYGCVGGLVRPSEDDVARPDFAEKLQRVDVLIARAASPGDFSKPSLDADGRNLGADFVGARDWLASVGAKDVVAFALFQRGDRYRLHVSELVRNAGGSVVVDFAAGRVATAPRVIDLGIERSWPDTLTRTTLCAQRGSVAADRHMADVELALPVSTT